MGQKISTHIVIGAALLAGANSYAEEATLPRSAAPADAKVYFVEPQDGAVVGESFTVKFGLTGMTVVPAGTDQPNSGHHHLLIDAETLPAVDQPMGGNVKHFGKGQTETTLELSKGTHTLQLILGDKNHIPHDQPVVSEKITVTVQ